MRGYDEMVRLIVEKSHLSKDKVLAMIWEKCKEFDVTLIGAAGMVGRELGVDVDGV